jgi:hypothetical protein
MDETSIQPRTRISDISGAIPIAAKGEVNLLLCLVYRGICGAVDDDMGSRRTYNLYNLIAISDVDLRDNGGYHLEFKICRTSA